MLYSASTDPQLKEWLNYQLSNAKGFSRDLAECAMTADVRDYTLLRPSLTAFRARDPEPSSTIRKLVRDEYIVTFDDSEEPVHLACAFNRFNGIAFNGSLPQTTIRWASSLWKMKEPGSALGLLALPADPTSHPLPSQLTIGTPHIFITERLKQVTPLDEWVLLHEMCHFKVQNHGPDFARELKRVLEATHWRVLLGG